MENESEEHLLMRLVAQKEQIGTWDDIADIMNGLTGESHTESCYRRRYKSQYGDMETSELAQLLGVDDYEGTLTSTHSAIDDKLRELEKAKIQYRDERNAWNKQNYLEARVTRDLDYLGEKLSQIGKINFNVKGNGVSVNSDNDLIVCLSDLHIGQTFNSWFGEYNSDIAKQRLNDYLEEIIKIGKRHKIENVYIFLGGDEISGGIHLSIKVSDRENIIDQIKLSSEYISSFIVELSKQFSNVYVSGVSGNHSRLSFSKEDAIKDERLDSLITWIVDQMTKHIGNICVLDNNIDSTISLMNIRGKDYCGVHGDMDFATDSGISRLALALGKIPYAIIGGHRHTPAYKEFNNVKYIQSGSMASCGDDHTISKRLTGHANQTVLVCNSKGIECIYNVELS